MRGVVVVGDAVSGDANSGSQSTPGEGSGQDETGDSGSTFAAESRGDGEGFSAADWGAIAFGLSLVAGLLSPVVFAIFFDDDPPQ